MRDVYATIDALERKAADRGVTEPERDALLAKATELRGANPPRPPAPPKRTATAADEPPFWFHTATTSATASTATTGTVYTNVTFWR